MNLTQVTYFTLAGYFETRVFKHLLFLILLCLYVFIIVSNVLLIVVICMTRSLHEPMYLFLCSLFVNELYGSTGLFPFLLLHVLSDIHTVSLSLCFLQIYCVYSYTTIEFFTLAIMSYDRFLAICYPLQYSTCMTFNRIAILIAIMWLLAFLIVTGTIVCSLSLKLCGNIINNVYCVNYSIVKLSCGDTTPNNIYGLFVTMVVVFVPLTLILFTYVKILKVCFSGCKQIRQKAVSTCTPHMASLLNFSFGVCFEVLQSRFDMSSAPNILRVILSLYFITCQPLFNPLMYGLRLSKIRHVCKCLLRFDM
ncbi:olfactory receptor 11A1-like [Solea senegalensis]|uniref:Olfactory receptor 11A1-like n=1 Tax=Solea senegalensis TaxID=28829 RepID=A0AAV6PK16_SOLSE|nr:olfactory receptor 478-like [Solea senegalensis]KAG7464232.1 olfactory receptor 11A1-like [Solea senegalensis]